MNLQKYTQASILTLILMLRSILSSSHAHKLLKARTVQAESNPIKIKSGHKVSKKEEEEHSESTSTSSSAEEEEESLSESESESEVSEEEMKKGKKEEEEYSASTSSSAEEEEEAPVSKKKSKPEAPKKEIKKGKKQEESSASTSTSSSAEEEEEESSASTSTSSSAEEEEEAPVTKKKAKPEAPKKEIKKGKKKEESTASTSTSSSAEEEEEAPVTKKKAKPEAPKKEIKKGKKKEESSASTSTSSSAEEEEETPVSKKKAKPEASKKAKEVKLEEVPAKSSGEKGISKGTKKEVSPKISSKELKPQPSSSKKTSATPISGPSYKSSSKKEKESEHIKRGAKAKKTTKTPTITPSQKIKKSKASPETSESSTQEEAQPSKQEKKKKKKTEEAVEQQGMISRFMSLVSPTSWFYGKEHEESEHEESEEKTPEEKGKERLKALMQKIPFEYETEPQEQQSLRNSIKFIKKYPEHFGHLFFNYKIIFSVLKMLEPKSDVFKEIRFGNDNTLKRLFKSIEGKNSVNDTSDNFYKYSYRLLFEILKLDSHDLNSDPNLFFKALLEHCLQAEILSIALKHQESYQIVNVYKTITLTYQSLLSSKFIESFCLVKRVNNKYVITPYLVTDYKNVRLETKTNGNHTLEVYPEDIMEVRTTYDIGEESKTSSSSNQVVHAPEFVITFYDYKKVLAGKHKLILNSFGSRNSILEVFDLANSKESFAEYKFDSLYNLDVTGVTAHNVFVIERNVVELYREGSKIDQNVPNAFPNINTSYAPNVLICSKTKQREPKKGYFIGALERFNPLRH